MNLTSILKQITGTIKNEIRTCIPAEIESFNPQNLTVDVKLLIKGIKIGSNRKIKLETGELVVVDDYTMPSVVDVPISIAWFGNGGITFPIKKGLQGILLVCDRDIRFFKKDQKESIQGSLRKFNVSDSIFIPFLPKRASLSNYNNDAVEIKFDNNIVQVNSTGINITGNVNITGDVVISGQASIAGKDFITHTHTYNPGPLPPTQTSPIT